jgi:hypothetical protein
VSAVVTVQESVTVPVKELPGVTVIVDVPLVEPEAMATLVGFAESVKLSAVLLGACQKSPQPGINAKNVAAANNPIQLPILITAPCAALGLRRQFTG